MQVRRVICEWLSWALRMSRPGKEISRQCLMRRARMCDLKAKTPPSLSLISNISSDFDAGVNETSLRPPTPVPLPSSSSTLCIPPPQSSMDSFYAHTGAGQRAHRATASAGVTMMTTTTSSPSVCCSHCCACCGRDVVGRGGVASTQQRHHESCCDSLHADLAAILKEVRFVTQRIKDDVANSDQTSDWKFAAMVIDRLCFWIFSVYFVVGTLAIFFSAPNMTIGL